MKERNKVIRLTSACASFATEVVSSEIKSKIRYNVATAGIPVETLHATSLQSQTRGMIDSRLTPFHDLPSRMKASNKDTTAGFPAALKSPIVERLLLNDYLN
jgi:hypothetical protein